jgi:hypothetical protein
MDRQAGKRIEQAHWQALEGNGFGCADAEYANPSRERSFTREIGNDIND